MQTSATAKDRNKKHSLERKYLSIILIPHYYVQQTQSNVIPSTMCTLTPVPEDFGNTTCLTYQIDN